MLRKRTRSVEKDQHMSHLTMSDSVVESIFNSENQKGNSFFNVPGLFIGLSPRGLADSDTARSPTSPLDYRAFSNLGNSFKSPKSTHYGQHKSWDTNKVGLSIIDSLDNDMKLSGKVLRSESKNILFGPQMRIKTPNSLTNNNSFEAPNLPKNYAISPYTQIKSPLQKGNFDVVNEIGETPFEEHEPFGKIRTCSLDSCRSSTALAGFADGRTNVSSGSFGFEKLASQESSPPILVGGSPSSNNFSHAKLNSVSVSIGSGNGFPESLSASEIELSEDYTRVVLHGPNPRTTHIYGDCILEGHTNDSSNFFKNESEGTDGVMSSTIRYPSGDLLSFCCSCNKILEGKDIYIYRGERGFCSTDCREQEILMDEEMEEDIKSEKSSPKSDDSEELSETYFFIAP